ncbi:MAG TPA: glycoside hydrolase family 3 C-terminal domain-containing protein [Opitutales bacterium]|nr:glycoside hydrolase family 3 C-terminal domain-containing protein [Opitutales bacterium]
MRYSFLLVWCVLALTTAALAASNDDCDCPAAAPPAAAAASAPDYYSRPLDTFYVSGRPAYISTALRFEDLAAPAAHLLPLAPLAAADSPDFGQVPVVKAPVIYTDPNQPFAPRVDDLIRRLSLNEKISQLGNDAPAIARLNIPAYNYWNEALHGVARAGTATVFPQAIGLSAMWDPAMLHNIADTIATEARGKFNDSVATGPWSAQEWQYYGLTFWSPNINLFRDPRWGRGQETYGEDTYLTGRMAVAFITGLQGSDPHYIKALATAKHYAVHSGPESTRHTANVSPSEKDFYNNYLPHFEAAVREGHVGTVMGAYNRVYGASASASPLLLTQILRDRWGFQGHVVSDCDSVEDIWKNHKIVATREAAVALALKAGLDLNCGFGTRNPPQYHSGLAGALAQGLITEHDIDQALHRVLLARFQLGLFDPPERVPYAKYTLADVDTPAHAALALRAARESIVLLKNSGVLPLDHARLKKIAVIGPNADTTQMLLGNYNGTPSQPVSILAGIRAAAAAGNIEVGYAPGCALVQGYRTAGTRGARGRAAPPPAPANGKLSASEQAQFNDAVKLAQGSDVVIYVGGISSQLEGEEMNTKLDGFSGGDRTRIELPVIQDQLLQALYATGRPVIFVNCSGSAIAMPWEAAHLPAIVQAWYPGEAGGTAVADVLFGDYNPSGRLPVTFYKSTADLPAFDDYSMANRTYRYFTGQPLFAFGHGLSYTSFSYDKLWSDAALVANDGTIRLFVEVANTGVRDGDEVIQVYAHPRGNRDPATPRKRLVNFQRVAIPKGQKLVVELDIPTQNLRLWDTRKKDYVVAPGLYDFQVGAASDDIRLQTGVKIAAPR